MLPSPRPRGEGAPKGRMRGALAFPEGADEGRFWFFLRPRLLLHATPPLPRRIPAQLFRRDPVAPGLLRHVAHAVGRLEHFQRGQARAAETDLADAGTDPVALAFPAEIGR